MSGFEVIHQSGPDGRHCALCGRQLAAERFSYQPGASVVMVDSDSGGSWRSQRSPNCQYVLRSIREARP